jgi:hypothetical protein
MFWHTLTLLCSFPIEAINKKYSGFHALLSKTKMSSDIGDGFALCGDDRGMELRHS